MSTITVTDLVGNFAEACRALVPALDRAEVPWRNEQQYDNWDRIAEPLFYTLVMEPCIFAAVGHTGLGRLQIARYGFMWNPACNAYLALDEPAPQRFFGLSSDATPFDEVLLAYVGGGGMRSLKLVDARFVFVFASSDGTDQRMAMVPLDAE